MLEIVCVPAIVLIVFSLMEVYKRTIAKDKECLTRIIPIIACVLGIILGVVCYYVYPDIIAATNVGTAILIGGASGLSATGFNQIFKQLAKYGIDVKESGETKDKDITEDNTKE